MLFQDATWAIAADNADNKPLLLSIEGDKHPWQFECGGHALLQSQRMICVGGGRTLNADELKSNYDDE